MKQSRNSSNRLRQYSRRKYTTEEKISIVMRGIDINCNTSKICKELGVPNSTFYIWRRMFIEAGKDRFIYGKSYLPRKKEFLESRIENKQLKRSIEKLEIRNQILKAMCSHGIDVGKRKGYTVLEKKFIIDLIENSGFGRQNILDELDLAKASYYRWLKQYKKFGIKGLKAKARSNLNSKNATPEYIKILIRDLIQKYPYIGDDNIKWYLVDNHDYYLNSSTINKLRKRENLYPEIVTRQDRNYTRRVIKRTKSVNELWHSDFTYLRKFDGYWHYLTIVMDDYSRYVVSWELTRSITGKDAVSVFKKAIEVVHLRQSESEEWPTILTDRGACYKSKIFRSFIKEKGLKHRMAAPRTLAERIRIERSFRSLKRALSIYGGKTPQDLAEFVDEYYSFYNKYRSHYSLNNLTPADIFFGNNKNIILHRNRVHKETLGAKGLYLDENKISRKIESDT